MVREGTALAGSDEQPTEIDRGLRLLALATTCVHSSPAWSARAASSIASAWSRQLGTLGLNNVPFIKAVLCSRNATWIRELAGGRCGGTGSNGVRALMFQVCLTLCISCGAALARPWRVSAYAEVRQRPESNWDHCGGLAARGVSGRIRQLHALVRQQAVKRRVFDREGVA